MRYNEAVSHMELYFDADNELGEGPIWDDRLQELQWVDIERGEIHRLRGVTQQHTVVALGQSIGSIGATTAGDCWIAGLRDGVALIDFDGTIRQSVCIDAERPAHRMNDSACDARGRFWTGTLNEEGGPPSDAVYRVDSDLKVTQVIEDVGLSNGIAWSPDGLTMYRVDSARGTVFRSDFNADAGTLAGESVLIAIPAAEGEPDGLTVDVEGGIWLAIWDGWCVRRYLPSGELDLVLSLPVQRPTSCAFGGQGLTDLFVTTASIGLRPKELADQPGAGAIFVARELNQGTPTGRFG